MLWILLAVPGLAEASGHHLPPASTKALWKNAKATGGLSNTWLRYHSPVFGDGFSMGTTYYVDSSSSAPSNQDAGTSPGAPLHSLDALRERSFAPGDVIAFKAGTTYNGGLVIRSSGTRDAPITFTSYGPGDKPVISNSGLYSDAISLEGVHHVIVDGLKVAGAHQSGISIDAASTNNVIRNCEATDVGLGFSVAGRYNLLADNEAHDLNMIVNTSSILHDDYGAIGIFISGSNNEARGNEIIRARAPSEDYGSDGGGFEIWGAVDGVSIHHNVVRDSEAFIEIGGPSGGAVDNLAINGNRSIDNGCFGVFHNNAGPFGMELRSICVSGNEIEDSRRLSGSALGPKKSCDRSFSNHVLGPVGVQSFLGAFGPCAK